MALLEELKRRNVIRVSTLYVVASWVIMQVADLLAGVTGVPDWSLRLVLIILVLGFPLVVVFSWVFEITPEGIVRDSEAREASAADTRKTQRLDIATVTLLLLAIGLVAWDRWSPRESAPPTSRPAAAETAEIPGQPTKAMPSIAVLPFVNMSANAENEYFSDGLTDTLLHKLAQVRALKVAARTSSFAFKGTNTDIREIAQALSVAHVLEGSVQRAGDQVRITAQLIQASDGYHLWSGNFDRELDDIFKVQDEIAAQVAKALTGSLLSEAELAAQRDGGTKNTAAYDAYLRGREAFRGGTEKQLTESVRLLRHAVTLDPNFALAWAALAESISRHGILSGVNYEDISTQMLAAADRAVELAPNNAAAVSTKAAVAFGARRWNEADALLQRAIELDPSNVPALSRLSSAEFLRGNYPEALELQRRAIALDPLDFDTKADLIWKYGQIGEVDKAKAVADELFEREPGSKSVRAQLAFVYENAGDFANAYLAYRDLLQDNPNAFYMVIAMARMFSSVGDEAQSLRWLAKAEHVNASALAHSMAMFCLEQGRKECAIKHLNMALTEMVDGRLIAEDWRALYRSLLGMLQGDWDVVWREQNASIQRAEARGDSSWALGAKRRAALAADRLNRIHERDALLADVADFAEHIARNGNRSSEPHRLWLEVHALRNEPDQAAESLRRAVAAGYRNLPNLRHDPAYHRVRDTPPMRLAIDEMREVLATERQKLDAHLAKESSEG